jgi:hypothetical protein
MGFIVLMYPSHRCASSSSKSMEKVHHAFQGILDPQLSVISRALADFGVTDAQFDAVYQRPRTFDEMETVALRLWDMTGRLERTTP